MRYYRPHIFSKGILSCIVSIIGHKRSQLNDYEVKTDLGPRTTPWKALYYMLLRLLKLFMILIFWILFVKHLWIKLSALDGTHYQKSLTIKNFWSMQSNAFKRWVNNVPNLFTPSRDFKFAGRQCWKLCSSRNSHYLVKSKNEIIIQ